MMRRHGERRSTHAANHYPEIDFLNRLCKLQCVGQTTGLVELDVNDLVSAARLLKVIECQAGLVGTER